MTPMVNFTVALLGAVSDFLSAEPVIYLFGVVLMIGLAKVVRTLIS